MVAGQTIDHKIWVMTRVQLGNKKKCPMNLELKKSRMVNKHSHYSLPEFLISRWKREGADLPLPLKL